MFFGHHFLDSGELRYEPPFIQVIAQKKGGGLTSDMLRPKIQKQKRQQFVLTVLFLLD